MIVVDTKIIAYLYLPSEWTNAAVALFKRDADWAAPRLWRSEFRDVLAGYMRRQVITFDQANALQHEAEGMLGGMEYDVDSTSVLELVRDSDCSAYDCEYVALAKKLGVKLVTMDQKLLKAFPNLADSLYRA